jgi:hypothetical protein
LNETNNGIELDSQTCGRIALHVYQQYKEAMKPSLFQVLSFEEWLTRLIDYHDRILDRDLKRTE